LQAKLVVGAAGDAFEREADRVADLLIRRAGAHPRADGPGPERPQREDAPVRVSRQTNREVDTGIDLPPDIAAQVERLRGGGMPLPARDRAIFEPLLGVDLGAIRIHTGIAAMQTARALQARAYAVGSEIAFGSGQYRPGTDSGRRLLAHELVHTVQQRGGVGPVRRDRPSPGKVDITPTTEPEQQEQPLVPDAASIKKHVEFVSAIENDQWIGYYEKHGEPPQVNLATSSSPQAGMPMLSSGTSRKTRVRRHCA
jgi:hypothetical protein